MDVPASEVKPQLTKEEEELEKELITKVKELPLKDRFKAVALNNLEKEITKLEREHMKEIRKVEYKYETQEAVFFSKIQDIIEGKRAPETSELTEIEKFLTPEEQGQKDAFLATPAPLEGFWLKALKNSRSIKHEITEKDEAALKHLVRIVKTTSPDNFDVTVEFTFTPNDHFTNTVLTKTVHYDDVGQRPLNTKGTEIKWNEGKNLTVKTIKKKQKNKKTGATRTVTKEEPAESFFNIFKDSAPCEDHDHDHDEDEEEDDSGFRFDIDVEMIEEINDVVGNSLEHFLGLVGGDEDDMDFEDDEDMDDDDEDDEDAKPSRRKSSKKDEDDEDDEKPKRKTSGKGAKGKPAGGKGKEGEFKPECKQQ